MDYDFIKELSRDLHRPTGTLIALARDNDPFFILPCRQVEAEWAAELWHRLEIPVGYHKRRIHYRLVSLAEPPLMPNGERYENTAECWQILGHGLRDAVYLGLLPSNAFTDNRNPDPILHQVDFEGASVDIEDGGLVSDLEMPELPRLALDRPTVPQPYQIELWCEKSTMNDILEPLAEQYGLNVSTAVGEFSATQCGQFVDRTEKHGRPARILYISDFDPAGQDMPVSVARKIEHELDRRGTFLDIEVRPIVLTHDQCVDLRLPRTPIKATERRAIAFEGRFGEGATELDALEAIHPGLLREILVEEIERYWNEDHDNDVDDICTEIEGQLERTTEEAIAAHQHDLDTLKAEFDEIARSYRAWLDLAKPLWQAIRISLDGQEPHLGEVNWCPDFDADEDDDPLFDSSRDYVEQINRYKEHQGKPTERKERSEEHRTNLSRSNAQAHQRRREGCSE